MCMYIYMYDDDLITAGNTDNWMFQVFIAGI